MTVETLVAVDLAQIDLRADPRLLPFDPPPPNTVTIWGDREVLWLGPDEWLVVGEAGDEEAIRRQLGAALAGHHRSIVDVSANRVVFDLSDALASLSSGCSLDLDPSRWRPGMCAQTLFGEAQVIIQQRDERTTRVLVRPSFADYFLDRFGLPSVT